MKNIIIEKQKSILSFQNEGIPFCDTEENFEIESSLETYTEIMKNLCLNQRINLIIRTLGFNPDTLTLYYKLNLLIQLAPYVMKKFNLMILGEKGTAKSTPYASYSAIPKILSEFPTLATLRGAKTEEQSIPLLNNQILIFEEIGANIDRVTLQFLKEVLQRYIFTDKSGKEIKIEVSTCFIGNNYTNISSISDLKKKNTIFNGISTSLIDDAFKDRFNAVLYRDEKFKLKEYHFLKKDEGGININLFINALTKLKENDYNIENNYNFDTPRDCARVFSTVKAFCKLLYPEGNISKVIINGLFDYAFHLRKIGESYHNPFNSLEFLIEALGLKNIENISLVNHRLLIKKNGEPYFFKIPLTEWALEHNRKELEYFKMENEISPYIATIDIDNSTEFCIKQEYHPLSSSKHTFNKLGELIVLNKENYAMNSEYNILLIENIKNHFIINSTLSKGDLKPWKEFSTSDLKLIVNSIFCFSNLELLKSEYSYDNHNNFKIINFYRYI